MHIKKSKVAACILAAALSISAFSLTAFAEDEQTTVDTATQTEASSNLGVVRLNTALMVRSGPGTDYGIVGYVYDDNVVEIEGEENGWLKIKSGNAEGYVSSVYVITDDEETLDSVGTDIVTVSTETLKVRADSNTDAEVLTLVAGTTEYTVLGEKDGWYQIATQDGYTGYISGEYAQVTETIYSYGENAEEHDERIAQEMAEAAAKAQEAAAAAPAQETETATQTETAASVTDTEAVTQTTTETAAQTTTEATYSDTTVEETTYTESYSSTGYSVVAYASQFLGNPYVWGGTSLTGGCDCSGFVMSVYANFGVSLPHSSYSLRSVGYGVSTSDMQAGDIVCYNGHVGIYAGNGQIINALNSTSGIVYTNVYYDTILAVRRIF